MMNMEKLRKFSLADAVADKLREEIQSGKYSPGDKLPCEPDLMEQFGVGRSTVREAVSALSNSGFVRVQQGSGTFGERKENFMEPLHLKLKQAKGDDLNEVRQLLELKIAEKAA